MASKIVASIIIPVYNRPRLIKECLDSIIGQKAKFPYEIILVDDDSTDDTVSVLKQLEKKYPKKIRMFAKQKNEGPWKTRNVGIRAAKGDIIVFTDSDCVARKDWLDKLTQRIRSGEVKASQGYSTGETLNVWQKIIQESYDRFVSGMVAKGYASGFDTRNSATAKEIFEKIGMFETRHAEDADLGARIVAAGYKIAFESKAVIFHYHRKELWKDLRANYFFATRYPLIIRKNWHLLKAQPGIFLRIAYGLLLLILVAGIPFWIAFAPVVFIAGIAILFLATVVRSLYSPFSLVPFRIIYFAANSVAATLGFVVGMPFGLMRYEPEERH